jgi:hypothetical protein
LLFKNQAATNRPAFGIGAEKEIIRVLTLRKNAMRETAYLQSSPANAARLLESIEQHKAGIIAHSSATLMKSDIMTLKTDKDSTRRSSKANEKMNRVSKRTKS